MQCNKSLTTRRRCLRRRYRYGQHRHTMSKPSEARHIPDASGANTSRDATLKPTANAVRVTLPTRPRTPPPRHAFAPPQYTMSKQSGVGHHCATARHPDATLNPVAPPRRPRYTYDCCRIVYRPLQRVWRHHCTAARHARRHPDPLGAAPRPAAATRLAPP